MDDTHFPIHPQILRIDTKVPFSIYEKVGDEGYEDFYNAGDEYTASVHGKLYNKSISKLHVNNNEKLTYIRYLEDNFDIIFNDPFLDVQNKVKISHELLTSSAFFLLKNPDFDKIIRYKKVVRILANFVFSNDDAINHLLSLTTRSAQKYNHIVNVGIYGMGLAKEIFTDPSSHNIAEVAAGFFLHDIGFYAVPKHIQEKKSSLSDSDWQFIKKHPEEGCKILEKYYCLTEETEKIILQHHERHNGSGYPKGLKGDQIHTYSKICSIADFFDSLTSNRPFRSAQKAFDALKIMRHEMKNEFDPKFFARFVLLFSKQLKK
ncbi:MAG: HD domain-containing protein [Candidatus Latescibacteria bacterium]|jgi:HD-GYP domain-containing protein (c-di-GMP phosphodiesterase class II)|nr:HD domain-containing protein [Candidatus Latescibacterota bacterium]